MKPSLCREELRRQRADKNTHPVRGLHVKRGAVIEVKLMSKTLCRIWTPQEKERSKTLPIKHKLVSRGYKYLNAKDFILYFGPDVHILQTQQTCQAEYLHISQTDDNTKTSFSVQKKDQVYHFSTLM